MIRHRIRARPMSLTLGGLLDRYEAMRHAGRSADQGAAQDDAGAAASSQALSGAARRPVLKGRPARGARRHGRGRHRHRGQPPAGYARSGAALGGRRRPDRGQLRPGDPAHAPEAKREPRADQEGDRGDLESLRRARPARGGEELRPHGALPVGHGAAARRGRLASLWPYPRRRVAAGREQGEPPAQPPAAAAGAGIGRAGRGAGLRVRRPRRQDRRVLAS